jgi:hypothetical protein
VCVGLAESIAYCAEDSRERSTLEQQAPENAVLWPAFAAFLPKYPDITV